MRRLSLKNKRKTLETKETEVSSNSEIKEENGGSQESSYGNVNSTRGAKSRRSRGQPDYESSEASWKNEEDSDGSAKSANENVGVTRGKRGRSNTNITKTDGSSDSLDSAGGANENYSRSSKGRKSRSQAAEADNVETPSKRRKRDEHEPIENREVESILAVRTVKNRRKYKVHWKGLPSEEDCWISENKLSCPEILQDFLRKQKEKKTLPKPIKVDGESEEYEVERVIEVRFKRGGKREFLIRWKGFSQNDDTWEPEDHLNCPELIAKFMEKVEKAKSVTSRELRANPVMTERLTLNMKSAKLRYSRRPQTQNRSDQQRILRRTRALPRAAAEQKK